MAMFWTIRIFWFATTFWLFADAQSCQTELAENGAKLCDEAFKETYEEHKVKLLTDAQKTACCLSFGMSDCVKFAFASAKCSPDEQEVAELISDKIKDAQGKLSSVFGQISDNLCGDINANKCQHMSKDYNEAREQIKIINGGGHLTPSFIAFFLSILGIYITGRNTC